MEEVKNDGVANGAADAGASGVRVSESDARAAITHLTKKLRQTETKLRNAKASTKKLLEIKRAAKSCLAGCIEHKCLETPCRDCSYFGTKCKSRRLLKLIDQHERGEHLREAAQPDLEAERSAETNGNETENERGAQ